MEIFPRRTGRAALVACIAVALVVGAAPLLAAQSGGVESLKGKPAPDWTLKRPDGSTVQLAKLKGEIVVIDFWATWCGPCRLAMPGLERLHQSWKTKKIKYPVHVIGLNAWEDDPSGTKALNYMKSQKLSYDLVLDADNVAARYGVEGIPTLVVVNPKGIVSEVKVGYDPKLEQSLDTVIAKLQKE